jgi:transposase
VVRSDAQRDEVSFYGSLNLHTGQEIVLRSEKMNETVSLKHLEQLLTIFPHQHMVLIWDRASWHKGARVRQFLAEHPRLETVYFPSLLQN